jgi:hypothetical protein
MLLQVTGTYRSRGKAVYTGVTFGVNSSKRKGGATIVSLRKKCGLQNKPMKFCRRMSEGDLLCVEEVV